MPIQFTCNSCGHAVEFDDGRAGKLILCDNCGHRQRLAGSASRKLAARALPSNPRVPKAAAAQPAAVAALTRSSNLFVLGTCVLILIIMFLPWISWPEDTPREIPAKADEYVPGIGLPFIIKGAAKEEVKRLTSMRDSGFYHKDAIDKRISALNVNAFHLNPAYLLLLLPIIAIAGFIDELYCARRGVRHWPVQVAVLMAPIIGIGLVFMTFEYAVRVSILLSLEEWTPKSGLFDWMGIGIYLLPLCIIGGLLGLVLSPTPTQDEWKKSQGRQRRAD